MAAGSRYHRGGIGQQIVAVRLEHTTLRPMGALSLSDYFHINRPYQRICTAASCHLTDTLELKHSLLMCPLPLLSRPLLDGQHEGAEVGCGDGGARRGGGDALGLDDVGECSEDDVGVVDVRLVADL